MAGISITASSLASVLGSSTLRYLVTEIKTLSKKLQAAVGDSADSLDSLQGQFTSLAQVVLQNHQAADFPPAGKGGTCLLLGEDAVSASTIPAW